MLMTLMMTAFANHPTITVQRACYDAFWTTNDARQCVRMLRAQHPTVAARTVAACEDSFYTSATRLQCLSAVSQRRVARGGELVDACEDAFYTSATRLQCIRQAPARRPNQARSVISACEDAFYTSATRLQCITTSQRIPYAAQAIQSCEDVTWTSSSRLACIEDSAPRPNRPVRPTPVYAEEPCPGDRIRRESRYSASYARRTSTSSSDVHVHSARR